MQDANTIRVLDPTFERVISQQGMADRPTTLNGAVVGLMANNKKNAEPLLEAIYDVLSERFEFGGRHAVNKGNASAPADPEFLDKLATEVDVVITSNGD